MYVIYPCRCVGKTEDPPICNEGQLDIVMSAENCGILNLEDSPFATCLGNPLMSVSNYLESCTFDACVNMANIREAVCGTLEALAVVCNNFGGVGDWRTVADCCKYK